MIKEAIVKIVNKEDLTYDEAYAVMNEIMVLPPIYISIFFIKFLSISFPSGVIIDSGWNCTPYMG